MHTHEYGCLRRSEVSDTPGTGVNSSFELPELDARKWTVILWKRGVSS